MAENTSSIDFLRCLCHNKTVRNEIIMANRKKVIGREVAVDFGKEIRNVPAKVDTGADSSAVWASDIFVDPEHVLHFKLFGKGSKYYTGIEHTAHKYRVKLRISLAGRKLSTTFGLSDRATHNYPILVGRKTLSGRFIVDVSQTEYLVKRKKNTPTNLNEEMKQNPYKFYKENYLNGENEK